MSDENFDLFRERQQKIEEAVKAAKEKYKGVLSNEEIQNLVTEYLSKLSDDDILDLNKVGGSTFFKPSLSENATYQRDVLERIIRETDPNFYSGKELKKASATRLQKIIEEKRKNQLEELNKKLATPNSDTLEKRLQRAKDMGFDTSQTYYHGTPSMVDFNEFDKPKDAGIYFSSDPQYVDKWSISEPDEFQKFQTTNPNEKPRTVPVFLRAKNTFDYNNPDHLEKLMKTVVKNDPWVFEQALLEKIPNTEQRNNFISSLHNNAAKYEEFIKNNPTLYFKALDEASRHITVNNDYRGIREIADRIKQAGFDSYISYDNDDLNKITKNIAVFDPKNIRSTFAKFDPSKTDSSDISSFVPKTTSEKAIGAAVKGLGYLDKGLTHLGHLSTATDFMQGNIPEAALDVAETALAKTGSAGVGRALPFLELLRPTEMEPKDDVTSDIPMKPERFRKLKQLYNKEE